MKRRNKKLTLHRETLRQLTQRNLEKAVAGARFIEDEPTIQHGETYCWCTETCNGCEEVR